MAPPPPDKKTPGLKSNPPRIEGDLLQIALGLTVEETPTKLRCASCNKLAREAWKLPCCDQSICEPCKETLAAECSVCSHSPLTSDLCIVNRNLRLTVRAHLMSIREKMKQAEGVTQTPAEPISAASMPPANVNGGLKDEKVAAIAPVAAATNIQDGQSKEATAAEAHKMTLHDTAHNRTTETSKDTKDAEDPKSDSASDCGTEFDLYSEAVQYTWQKMLNGFRIKVGLAEKPINKALIKSYMERKEQELNKLQQRVQTSHVKGNDQRPSSRRSSGQSDLKVSEQDTATGQNQNAPQDQSDKQTVTPAQEQNPSQPQTHTQTQIQPQIQNHAQIQDYNQNQAFSGNQNYGQNQQFGQNAVYAQNQGFGGMNNADMNAMMQMQWQWMSMPGMNMNMPDPSMMFGGGYGGMNGMNGMMNMDMGAMGGMNGYGGMNGGAYFPHNGGYNPQQNFGAGSMMNTSNSFAHNDRGYGGQGQFNNRGGVYGRGGRGNFNRGRGGWQNFDQHLPYQGQHNTMQYPQTPQNFHGNDEGLNDAAQQGATRGSPSYEPMNGRNGTVTDAKVLTASTEDETADVNTSITVEKTNTTGNEIINQSANKAEKTTASATEGAAKGMANADAVSKPAATYSIGVNAGAAQGHTAPVNAPTGPKAMRQGQGQGQAINGRLPRPQQSVASAVLASPMDPEHSKTSAHEPRGRSRSRSPSRSHTGGHRDRRRSPRPTDGSGAPHETRDRRESRKRKDRTEYVDEKHVGDINGDKPRKKARSESPEDGHSRRRHREKDETRHSSRSHRDASSDRRKDRRRSRSPKKESNVNGGERRKDRYRSRSPRRDRDAENEKREQSRRKSRSDRKREDEYEDSDRKERGRSHKHTSRRYEEDERDGKEHTSHSTRTRESASKHHERDSDRNERDRRRSGIDGLAQDGGEFKIKGRSAMNQVGQTDSEKKMVKSSAEAPYNERQSLEKPQTTHGSASMRPPSTVKSEHNEHRSSMPTASGTSPAVDIYAEEREKARKVREEMQLKRVEGRRVSSQSLGKRFRDEEDFDAPTGPSGDHDRMHGNKRPKKDMRKHSLKFEGEIDGHHDSRDNRRYR